MTFWDMTNQTTIISLLYNFPFHSVFNHWSTRTVVGNIVLTLAIFHSLAVFTYLFLSYDKFSKVAPKVCEPSGGGD